MLWSFIHNVIAHPMLFFTDSADWARRLHDVSKRSMPHFGTVLENAVLAERQRCWLVAHRRADLCAQMAERYDREKSDPSWSSSERCAQREAEHIALEIINPE